MKFVIRLLQLAFALTFIFSGVSKCIDPTGTSLKFNEYLLYFGLGGLTDFTMGLAWVMSILEFVIGFNLMMGRVQKVSLFLAICLMLFFTPLTLWLACTDAIQDCGCFGDALHLTNWQTFWKNVVLDVILALLIWKKEYLYSLVGKTNYTFYAYWCLFIVIGLCWYGTFRDPYIDFRPFHPGINVAERVLGSSQTTADSADEIIYTCIYERNGERKEFPLEELPDEADGWEFVETVERSASNSEELGVGSEELPAAGTVDDKPLDFFARTPEGELFTEDLLTRDGYTLVMLSPSLDHASQHDLDRIEKLYEFAQDQQYAFYCLTARDTVQLNNWKFNTGAEYPFLFTDMQIVETITRANPGIMLLKDGVLCWKENLSSLDVNALVSAKLDEQSYGEIHEIDYNKRFLALLILLFGPMPLSLCFEIPNFLKKLKGKKEEDHK